MDLHSHRALREHCLAKIKKYICSIMELNMLKARDWIAGFLLSCYDQSKSKPCTTGVYGDMLIIHHTRERLNILQYI